MKPDRRKIEDIKRKVLPVLKSAQVKRSSLFGSLVRGEDDPESDVDLLMEMPKHKSLLDLVNLKRRLEEALHREVDVVTYNSVHPLLKKEIFKYELKIL